MEQVKKPKIDISTILLNLLGIAFLCYVSWMLRHIGVKLRVIAVYALMMPHFISIWRTVRNCGRITKTEQWVFVLIAVILWVIQSFFTGKLRYLL
ncbi:MAG: hypothetical protein FJ041_05105 [Candidatus Cloacimonetes bacterium]|nr:hypothetical protein [Candidatus Cloacimonadota bacterium]